MFVPFYAARMSLFNPDFFNSVAVQGLRPPNCAAKMSSRSFPCYQTKMPLTPGAQVT